MELLVHLFDDLLPIFAKAIGIQFGADRLEALLFVRCCGSICRHQIAKDLYRSPLVQHHFAHTLSLQLQRLLRQHHGIKLVLGRYGLIPSQLLLYLGTCR